jgi:transposase InsO family protein
MTYIGTEEGWLCLADVLDLGSRRIVGYAMDDNMRTEPVTRALSITFDIRGDDVKKMIFRLDRGSRYMSSDFRTLCERNGIAQSVGRTGSCHDNAVAESLWPTMGREFVHRSHFAFGGDARRVITGWFNRYNAVRKHSSISDMTLIEWELQFALRHILVAEKCVRNVRGRSQGNASTNRCLVRHHR